MFVKLTPPELQHITSVTLGHYEENSRSFWDGTKEHDVTQNYQALLQALPKGRPLRLLDLGCGPGRDLRYFKEQGHEPIGVEGCKSFCAMARAYSGCEVWEQDFLKLTLPAESFDGVFANASLFHVPAQELPRVLKELRNSLKTGGILFSSNPRGQDEGWAGDRYGSYMEFETYQDYLEGAGFKILHHYYRPPGKPRHEQAWLAVVAQKLEEGAHLC